MMYNNYKIKIKVDEKGEIKMKEVVVLIEIEFVDEVDDNYVYRKLNEIDIDDVLENDDKVKKFDYIVLKKIK